MGGRSRSSQSTQSQQSTVNEVNDGTFAGASNVSVDESDNSIQIEDSGNTDNSIAIEDSGNTTTETEIEESFNTTNETETNFEESFNTDNSVTTNFEDRSDRSDRRDQSTNDSFNTDNSIDIENDGEFAGNSGTINILDAGAVEGGLALANNAIFGANEQLNSALESSENAIDRFAEAVESNTISIIDGANDNLNDSLNFASGIVDSFSGASSEAIQAVRDSEFDTLSFASEQSELFAGEIGDIASNITEDVFTFAQAQTEGFRDSLTESSREFALNLGSISASTNGNNQSILQSLAESQTENIDAISSLAESAATGGQSIVAESSVQVVQVVAVAFVAIAIAVAIRGRK